MHRILFLLFTLLCSTKLMAYPNFVGFGYGSCLTCHYNPMGNGPLTDYGRALGATTISDRVFVSAETTDHEIGQTSGFFYSKHKNEWLRPSLDYRGLYLKKNYGTETEKSEFIHMDATANVVLRLGGKEKPDKLIVSGSFGYAPKPRSNPNSDEKTYRTREHYIGWRINDNFGLYAGLMDKAYGIRIVDHIAYSRSLTNNTMNDQVHGVQLHYTSEKMDLALHPFVGNLGEKANVRQTGVAATGEYSLALRARLGGSFMTSSSEFVEQSAYALHARLGFGEGSSFMTELGQVQKKVVLQNTTTDSRYLMIQNHILAKRGLFILNTIEYLRADLNKEDFSMRWGPGAQYFIAQGLELRMDLYNTRTFSHTAVSQDIWDLTGQVHLWF